MNVLVKLARIFTTFCVLSCDCQEKAMGMSFLQLEQKILRGIPNLLVACNKRLSNLAYCDQLILKQSALGRKEITEFTGGFYDGTDILQIMLGISNDLDVMFRRCDPLSQKQFDKMIEEVQGTSGIYCYLNVSDFPEFWEYPTFTEDGITYLSSAKFRLFYLEDKDVRAADKLFGIHRYLEGNCADVIGKASHKRIFHGNQPIDVVHYIPCDIDSTYWYMIGKEKKVVKESIGLIPKGRPNDNRGIEWRISFSFLENKIIKDTWTNTDHVAYALLKCIVKVHVAMPEILTSYHLKMCMFLAQQQVDVSNMSFGQRLLLVLDILLHSLEKGVLRHAFLQEGDEFNLFEAISDKLKVDIRNKLSAFVQEIKNMPDDLNLYKNNREPRRELVYILCLVAVSDIERNIASLYTEYGPLVLDQETNLNIFETYLKKALKFICSSDESLVKDALNNPSLIRKRYEFILSNLRFAFNARKDFGLNHLKTKTLSEYFPPNKIFYQFYDGHSVKMRMRQIEVNDLQSPGNVCLSSVTQTYGQTLVVSSHSGSSYLIRVPYIRPEVSLILNLWSVRQEYWHQKKAFMEQGCVEGHSKYCSVGGWQKSIFKSIINCVYHHELS